MKDEKYGMFLEWALLSQTQTCQNHDILENMRKENIVPRLNTQICNTINTLDSMNWGTASSVNAASHVFIHEAPEFQDEGLNEWCLLHVVERKEGGERKRKRFEKIRKALYTLVDELNGVIESLIDELNGVIESLIEL